MSQEVFQRRYRQWFEDLCEYYDVTPAQALELGTRSPNRKPSLPSSKTTHAVKGQTFEDIWSSRPRKSQDEIFQFYKDQGAWSSFRQVVRHKDMSQYHISVLSKVLKEDVVYCEYGCGVAPYTNSLLEVIDPESKLTVYLSDVDSEHLTFGVWRCQRTLERRSLKNVSLIKMPVLPDALPAYEKKLDAVIVFEVLEHVPSPVSTVRNLWEQMNSDAVICENFIKHDHDGQDGPDLHSAALERSSYYEFLRANFRLVDGESEENSPNATRIWERR